MGNATSVPADPTFSTRLRRARPTNDDFTSSWFVRPRRIRELLSVGLLNDMLRREASVEPRHLTRTLHKRALMPEPPPCFA
jgi:hypothetical protein